MNNQVLRKLEENNKKIENKLISMHRECINKIQTAALAASQHSKIFPQFKNKHKGKDCVLVATGPTLNYYEPIKNAIHIGVNSAYKKESINLDYWFAIDFNPIKDYTHELKSIKSIKFFGQSYQTFPCNYYTSYFGHIPDSIIFSDNKSYKFYFDQCNFSSLNIDIETQLLPDLGSSIFQAAYFALYTGVKRIYLVGCDCSNKGHWNDTQQNRSNLLNILPLNWKKFKEFTEKFYPDVEIISINPIGLKGIFKEIYTKSFTENNTEIKSKI